MPRDRDMLGYAPSNPCGTPRRGPKGDKGDPGERGPRGFRGEKGDPGEPGSASGDSAIRFIVAVVPAGQSSVTVVISAGEKVGAPGQQRSDSGVQYQGVDYAGLNATLQFTAAVEDDLEILIPVKRP